MAKTKVNNEEYEMKDSEISNEERIGEQNEVVPEATITKGKKNVRVRVVEDVDCFIACIQYKIEKDKEANVPIDVAAILCNAKKAYRI